MAKARQTNWAHLHALEPVRGEGYLHRRAGLHELVKLSQSLLVLVKWWVEVGEGGKREISKGRQLRRN